MLRYLKAALGQQGDYQDPQWAQRRDAAVRQVDFEPRTEAAIPNERILIFSSRLA